VRLLQGAKSIADPRATAITADGIPLDRFDAAAAHIVVLLFALTGFAFVLLGVLGILALVRYRAMIPFVFLLFLADYVLRKAVVMTYDVVRSSATPIGLYVNYAVLAVLVAGFVLSLLNLRKPPA
jgi:hypothetical protein